MQFVYILSWLKKCILQMIAPPMCAYCKSFISERMILCLLCKNNITPLVSVAIQINKKYSIPVMAIGEYKDPLKKLILSKGWSDYVASCELGQLMHELTPIKHMQFDIVVPIPLHWTRYVWRGYNQAHEMGIVLAKRLNIPCVALLKRVRATPLQSSVAHDERSQNVKQAFAFTVANLDQFKYKRILLVDDLMTTGSTLQSAAQILTRINPVEIRAVVAARVK